MWQVKDVWTSDSEGTGRLFITDNASELEQIAFKKLMLMTIGINPGVRQEFWLKKNTDFYALLKAL